MRFEKDNLSDQALMKPCKLYDAAPKCIKKEWITIADQLN